MAFIRELTRRSQSEPLPKAPISEGDLGTQVQGPKAKTTEEVGGVFARIFQRRENKQPTPKRDIKALTASIIPMNPKIYDEDMLTIGNAIREVYNSTEGKKTEEFTTEKDVKSWLYEIKPKLSNSRFQWYIDAGLSSLPPEDRARFRDALIERKSYATHLLTIGNAIREVYNLEKGESIEQFSSDSDVITWLAEVRSDANIDRYLLTAWKGFPGENRDQLMTAYFRGLRAE